MSNNNALILLTYGQDRFLALSTDDFEKALFKGQEFSLRSQNNNNSLTTSNQVSAQLVTAKELSELTSVPETWFMEQARQGKLSHVRLGKYVRFRPYEVIESSLFKARSNK